MRPPTEAASNTSYGVSITANPPGNEAHKRYDQQAFIRHIHFATRHFGSDECDRLIALAAFHCGATVIVVMLPNGRCRLFRQKPRSICQIHHFR
jgi:hypothetical protein